MSDKDGIYNNQNKETCEGHPNISRRLAEERDIQKQQTTNR